MFSHKTLFIVLHTSLVFVQLRISLYCISYCMEICIIIIIVSAKRKLFGKILKLVWKFPKNKLIKNTYISKVFE